MKHLNDLLWKLEGLHTVETVQKELNLTRQSTINLLSKLKKLGYVTVKGGGKQIRLYKITMTKQRPRSEGMWDILNKYSGMMLNPWYDHQVHGKYGPEGALIDAIKTRSFRITLAAVALYPHIKDWKRVWKLAKKHDVEQEVMALYELSRKYFRVKRIKKQRLSKLRTKHLVRDYKTKEHNEIYKKYRVHIPFRKKDMYKVIS